jgi:hypothetical protein
MSIIKNKVTVPSPVLASKAMVESELSGNVTNGYTLIFADLQPGASGEVNIKFSVTINSVNVKTFDNWRNEVSKILGPTVEEKIARFSGIATVVDEPAQFAAQYALAAFSFVYNGDFTSFENQSTFAFVQQPCPEYIQLATSILQLDSQELTLRGELTATIENPDVEAFIAVTYFHFTNNNKVTSFSSYRGPIVLVEGDEEVVIQPGILDESDPT